MRLGGFAKDEYEVDGDFEAFNFCLAENYYDAMLGEEWDLLEGINFMTIDDIVFWLGYCEELEEQNKDIIENIIDGTFMTVNNRTFIDAIVEEKKVDLAEAYIISGSTDIRLYILYMFYFEDSFDIGHEDFVYHGTILNRVCRSNSSREKIVEFLFSVLMELDKIYNDLEIEIQKIMFLNVVRNNLRNISYSS